jgi:uncharacterized protein Yka (UPF0111/DUF47 family)
VRLALVPRTSEFYDLFARAGANALQAARKAETRFREYPNSSITQADVKETEREGDRITHDIIQLLNTQYVTPFDREDIYELATAIDDIVDLIDEASDHLDLYGIESPTKHALDQCRILVSEAIGSLFQDPRIDPLIVIRWKDIYDGLENAIDACETSANVLGNIAVKNA